MKVVAFSAKTYDQEFLIAANASRLELHFFEAHLSARQGDQSKVERRKKIICDTGL